MSSRVRKKSLRPQGTSAEQPRIGALLRLAWRRVRERQFAAIQAAGFTDIQETHFPVFSYPVPDGMRPSELARNMHMSRQAANYLIDQLEGMGYLERRASEDSERRLVYLTGRGRQVVDVIVAALNELTDEWSEQFGRERFADVMDVLRHMAMDDQP